MTSENSTRENTSPSSFTSSSSVSSLNIPRSSNVTSLEANDDSTDIRETNSNSHSDSNETGSHNKSAVDSNNWDFVTDAIQTRYRPTRSYSSTSVGSAVSAEDVGFLNLLGPAFTVKVSKDTINHLKKRTKKFKDRAKFETGRFINKLSEEDLRKRFIRRLDKLDVLFTENFATSNFEKKFYMFALLLIFYAGIVIGKYPNQFHLYYSALFCLLMPIRLYTYWRRQFEFFLADLCYYVNVLTMLFIWVFPYSKHLYTVCFSFTFGTLAFAVITWRNSLVLHSIEKTTSAFIHIFPPAAMFVITHEIDSDFKKLRFPGAYKVKSYSVWNGVIWTSFYYLLWQANYHYFITIRQKDKIEKGRMTSFSWLRKSYAKQPIGKFVNSLPEPFPVVAFMTIQYGYQLSSMLLCPIWMRYKKLAGIFMMFIFAVAAHNGATYYVDIFGKKLEKEVVKLKEEIQQLQSILESEAELMEDLRENVIIEDEKNDAKKEEMK